MIAKTSNLKIANSNIVFFKRLFLINSIYLSFLILLVLAFDCYVAFYVFFALLLSYCAALLISILRYVNLCIFFFHFNNIAIAILANIFFSNGFGFELFLLINISYCYVGNFKRKLSIFYLLGISTFIYLLLYYAELFEVFNAIYYEKVEQYRLYFLIFNLAFLCLNFIGALLFMRKKIITNIEQKHFTQILLKENISKDYLTGLFNRWGFLAELEKYNTQINVNFALIDIDNFKYVNSNFGFECGDDFLIKSANLLKKTFHNSLVCRWSSEQFIIFNTTLNNQDFVNKADEFRNYFKAFNFKLKDNFYRATVSIGCVGIIGEFSILQLENIITEINKNLYLSKQQKDELNASKM